MSCINFIKIKHSTKLSSDSKLVFFIILKKGTEKKYIKFNVSKEIYNFIEFNKLIKNTNSIFLFEKIEIKEKKSYID